MTRVRCAAVKGDELPALLDGLPAPVWNSGAAARIYGDVLGLVCYSKQGAVIGAWVCPLDGDPVGERPAARRATRLLPYASPWVDLDLHATARHRVVLAMAEELLRHVDAVELPMDPGFGEVAALLEAGLDAPARHSRVLDVNDLERVRAGYLPQVRNHIRAAGREHAVERVGAEEFDFSRGVVNQPPEIVAARSRSGVDISADHPVLCLAAVDGGGACRGQVFVLGSAGSAVLMHSWFDRDGTRGVPSLLVDAAISRAVEELDVRVFDFEGSVIPAVDRFMAGFGARAAAYPQARWERSAGFGAEFG